MSQKNAWVSSLLTHLSNTCDKVFLVSGIILYHLEEQIFSFKKKKKIKIASEIPVEVSQFKPALILKLKDDCNFR